MQDVYEPVLKQGTMAKRQKGFPYAWQDRSFTLHATKIDYFHQGVLKGTFHLFSSTVIEVTKSEKVNSFKVINHDHMLWLCAPNSDAMQEWMEAIQGAIDDAEDEKGEDDEEDDEEEEEEEEVVSTLSAAAANAKLHGAAQEGRLNELKEALNTPGVNVNHRDSTNRTAIHLAAFFNKPDCVKALLNKGADLTLLTQGKETVLGYASKRGNLEIVKMLLNKNCPTNIPGAYHETPLHFASKNGYADIVKLLLAKGASLTAKNDSNKNPYQVASNAAVRSAFAAAGYKPEEDQGAIDDANGKLHSAAQNGRTSELKDALAVPGVNVNHRDSTNRTAIHLAAFFNKPDCVQLLLDKGADLTLLTQGKETVLGYASKRGNKDIVRMLLNKKCPTNIPGAYHETPLHFASKNGYVEIVKMLLAAKASVTALNDNKQTPRQVASSAAVRNAFNEAGVGADGEEEEINEANMKLHGAAQNGRYTELKEALNSPGVNVNHRDSTNRTAIHLAAFFNKPDCVQLLLDKGADLTLLTQGKETVLGYASKRGNKDIVRMLLNKKCPTNIPGAYHETPLHFASKNGYVEIVKMLLAAKASVTALNDSRQTPRQVAGSQAVRDAFTAAGHGAAAGEDDKIDPNTRLHGAAQNGIYSELRDALNTPGVNVNHRDSTNRTAIHLAAFFNKIDCVQLLLDKGADLTLLTQGKETVLGYASKRGNTEIVRLLLSKNCPTNIPGAYHETPLHFASKNGYVEIVKMLLNAGASVKAKNNSNDTPLQVASNASVRDAFEDAGFGDDESESDSDSEDDSLASSDDDSSVDNDDDNNDDDDDDDNESDQGDFDADGDGGAGADCDLDGTGGDDLDGDRDGRKKVTRIRTKIKPQTFLDNEYCGDLLELVARSSTKPGIGTYVVTLDDENYVKVRNDIYDLEEVYRLKDFEMPTLHTLDLSEVDKAADVETTRLSMMPNAAAKAKVEAAVAEKNRNARKSVFGRQSEAAFEEDENMMINVVAIYEDSSTIRVILGCSTNAIIIWEVFNDIRGFHNGASWYVSLPAPLSRKEALKEQKKAAKAAAAAAAAAEAAMMARNSKKNARGSTEGLDDTGGDVDAEAEADAAAEKEIAEMEEATVNIYSIATFEYHDKANDYKYGVAIVGRDDGYVTYINITAPKEVGNIERTLFYSYIGKSNINVLSVTVPPRYGKEKKKDEIGSAADCNPVVSSIANNTAFVFAGLSNGDMVRWNLVMPANVTKEGLHKLESKEEEDGRPSTVLTPLSILSSVEGRRDLRKHSEAVTSFCVMDIQYDEPRHNVFKEPSAPEEDEEPKHMWALFSASEDSSIIMWHIETSNVLRIFEGHEETVTAISLYTPSTSILDAILVSGSTDGTIKTWSVHFGTELSSFEVGHIETVALVPLSVPVPSAADKETLFMQPPIPLLLYGVEEDVIVKEMTTGATTLDSVLKPCTAVSMSACTGPQGQSLCFVVHAQEKEVGEGVKGSEVRLLRTIEKHEEDGEDFDVVVGDDDEVENIVKISTLVLSSKDMVVNDEAIPDVLVLVVHADSEGSPEEDGYKLTLFGVDAESPDSYFDKTMFRRITADGEFDSHSVVSLFELNSLPVIATLVASEEDSDLVTLKIWDAVRRRSILEEFTCSEPMPKLAQVDVGFMRVVVDDELDGEGSSRGGFTVYLAATDKGGSIYVLPYVPRPVDSEGNYIEIETNRKQKGDDTGGDNASSFAGTGDGKKKVRSKKGKSLTGHQRRITMLGTMLGKNAYIISGSEDRSVRLWNPRTHQVVHVLQGHKDAVCAALHLPHPKDTSNQEFVVTADVKGIICVWDAESGDLMQKLVDASFDQINLCYIHTGKLPDGFEDYESPVMIVSSGKNSLSFWNIFEDAMPSRREMLSAFNSDRKSVRRLRDKEAKNDERQAEKADEDDEEGANAAGAKMINVSFNSVELLLKRREDDRAVLAHCGAPLFRKAVQSNMWSFVDTFLPKAPDVLLHRSTYRRIKKRDDDAATSKKKKDAKVIELPYIDGATECSLLEDAMLHQKIRTITVILAAWTKLLGTQPVDLLAQYNFPFNALKRDELFYLASNYPKEFQDFIVSLKPLRGDEDVLGDAVTFPLGDSKFFFAGLTPIETSATRHNIVNTVFNRPLPIWHVWKQEEVDSQGDDGDAEQIVSGFFLPLKNAASPSLLSVYINVCEVLEGDKTIFGSIVAVMATRYAWNKYGRAKHVITTLRFMAFAVIFIISALVYGLLYNRELPHTRGWKIVNVVLQLLVLIGNTYYLYLEFMQLINTSGSITEAYQRQTVTTKSESSKISLNPKKWLKGLAKLFPEGFYDYVTDPWNQIDVVMLGCIYASSLRHIFSLEETRMARSFLAVANVLVWFKMMYYARSNSNMGPLIAMIQQITHDIRAFLVVLATILFGYAFSFWIMVYQQGSNNSFATIGGTLLWSFSFMLGGFDPTSFEGTPVESFTILLAVAFMLIVSIILLNLLIAIMGNSYAIVQERTNQQFRWEQASSIVDQLKLRLVANPKADRNPEQVHFVARDSTFAKGSEDYVDIDGVDEEESGNAMVTEKELSDKLGEMQTMLLKQGKGNFNDVNNKITNLEDKIDALIQQMKIEAFSSASPEKKKKGVLGKLGVR